jgi:hypothetical protein
MFHTEECTQQINKIIAKLQTADFTKDIKLLIAEAYYRGREDMWREQEARAKAILAMKTEEKTAPGGAWEDG